MVGTAAFFNCRRLSKQWRKCSSREHFGRSSVRLRFRRRLAVGLLRVWNDRLCLVRLLVFALLQLALHSPADIDSRT